jgi:predicted amidohydrolase YtcJ
MVFNSELKYNLPTELTYFTIQNKSSNPTNFSTLIQEQKIISTDLSNTVLFSQTKWASYQNFEELNLGTLEKNKWATFIVMNSKINKSSTNFPLQIYSKGKIIYNAY